MTDHNVVVSRNFLTPRLGRDELVASFDRLFDEMMGGWPEFTTFFGVQPFQKHSYPKVNILENDKSIIFEAELPSFRKDDVKLSVDEGVLTISGERSKLSSEEKEKVYIYKELSRSAFSRSFKLDDAIFDSDKIDAKFEDGMLYITVPKREQQVITKKTIPIK